MITSRPPRGFNYPPRPIPLRVFHTKPARETNSRSRIRDHTGFSTLMLHDTTEPGDDSEPTTDMLDLFDEYVFDEYDNPYAYQYT